MIPTVLSIAGLDPSGGAGMAADLKTATMMGTYGMAALTTVTIQHPGAVEEVSPLPARLVKAQIQTLLQHMPIGAIKIGLLGTTDIANAVMHVLQDTNIPMVLDPVTHSTSGTAMGEVDETVMTHLMERAHIVTPNNDELTGVVGGWSPAEWANHTATAVLCTGGHSHAEAIVDVLWVPNKGRREWSRPRIETVHTHGTGCTISTAIAAGLAKGHSIERAVEEAISFTHQAVQHSTEGGLVDTNGPLLHFKMND